MIFFNFTKVRRYEFCVIFCPENAPWILVLCILSKKCTDMFWLVKKVFTKLILFVTWKKCREMLLFKSVNLQFFSKICRHVFFEVRRLIFFRKCFGMSFWHSMGTLLRVTVQKISCGDRLLHPALRTQFLQWCGAAIGFLNVRGPFVRDSVPLASCWRGGPRCFIFLRARVHFLHVLRPAVFAPYFSFKMFSKTYQTLQVGRHLWFKMPLHKTIQGCFYKLIQLCGEVWPGIMTITQAWDRQNQDLHWHLDRHRLFSCRDNYIIETIV